MGPSSGWGVHACVCLPPLRGDLIRVEHADADGEPCALLRAGPELRPDHTADLGLVSPYPTAVGVPREEQFDGLNAVGEDLSRLERVKKELGQSVYDAHLEAVHDRYMTAFLRHFTIGHRKRVVPVWLKAPRGTVVLLGRVTAFHWTGGRLPAWSCDIANATSTAGAWCW